MRSSGRLIDRSVRPTELELRRIVSLPVRVAGGVLEPGLVDAVIADTKAAPGALPLVSTAMLESWSHRVDTMVRSTAIAPSGGVGGAIASLAEGVWAGFDPARAARWRRSMLLRLSGEATKADVNNPVRTQRTRPGIGDDSGAARPRPTGAPTARHR